MLKIRTICHAWDLWKLIPSGKQFCLLCPPGPWNLPGYSVDFKASSRDFSSYTSLLPESFQIRWVRQYLINVILYGIKLCVGPVNIFIIFDTAYVIYIMISRLHALHRNQKFVILMKLSSLAAIEVVKMTTSRAVIDEYFATMITFSFQLLGTSMRHCYTLPYIQPQLTSGRRNVYASKFSQQRPWFGEILYITCQIMSPYFFHVKKSGSIWWTLQWRHNDHDCVSNHQPRGCLLNRLFRRTSKKTSKLRVTGLCVGNSPGPVNSPHKGPVTRKMFPFDDVIMKKHWFASITQGQSVHLTPLIP